MSRLVIALEYDGRDFEGWQIQPHGRTVQNAIQLALSSIADQPISVVCAGRTDTGVHAAVQIAHFETSAVRPLSAWVRGTNAHLPDSVAIRWALEVDDQFHARFSAKSRRYRYLLLNRPVRAALHHGRVGWFHAPLDAALMQRAATQFIGEHDFSAFRAAECQAASPIRRVTEASVVRRGEWIVFEFEANAFLHHMVRNMVGALVYVGKRAHPPEWIEQVLAMRDRKYAAPTFSPAGLYLCGIQYPNAWNLPNDGRIVAPFELPEFGRQID